MEDLRSSEFDRSWLRRKISVEDYFGRDVRRSVIEKYARQHPEVTAEFRRQLAAERIAIAAVWQDGDELWEWRNEKFGPKLEMTDSVGEMGIAVIRSGCVIAAWTKGTWA
jgi:hypothetical protein